MKRQTSVVVGVRLTRPDQKRLTQLAKLEGRSLSAFIRRAVERQIESERAK
jgi:predicted DNA-binding protein